MKKSKARFAAVWLVSTLITIVLLGGTGMLLYQKYFSPESSSKEESYSGDDLVFTPGEEHSQTTLFILDAGDGENNKIFVLSRFLPADGQFILIPMPGKTFCQVNTKKTTLYEFYRTGGSSSAVSAFENALNIPIEKYMKFDRDSFNTLVDILGGANVDLPRDFFYINPETGENTNLKKGRQLLDGNKLRQLLTFPEFDEGEDFRTKITASVLADMLNGAVSERLADTLDNSFKAIINSVETNISALDYDFRKKAIEYLIRPGTKPVTFKLPQGEYSKDKQPVFMLDSKFGEDVAYWFKVESLMPS
ncbi:MAG: polyisoprenyl-teichoic acid--peptidoglycan teichoic acid transferase [Clostridiales bacterium]|nr:polyisoprenyl-teichoic acid--peptidoglycan teichoic acid transferase [Clostridiales bacterium]